MKRLLPFILGFVLALFLASPTYACACMFIRPENGFDIAEAVFTGKVVRKRKSEWIVEVNRVWKGDVKSQVILFDALPRSSCSIGNLKNGHEFLFLVDVENNDWTTRYSPQPCNWTTRLRTVRIKFEDKRITIEKDGVTPFLEDWVLKGRGEGQPPKLKQ